MEIIAMILETAAEGATKTRIMYAAYLSFQQVKDYLDYLQGNDLILYENETGFYKVTEKGNRFLRISNELNDLFSFKNSEFNNSFGV
jgi:predicted transcriptional regulator